MPGAGLRIELARRDATIERLEAALAEATAAAGLPALPEMNPAEMEVDFYFLPPLHSSELV